MKKSVKISIAVLCLIIVGLVGFIVWDKIIKKDSNVSNKFENNNLENCKGYWYTENQSDELVTEYTELHIKDINNNTVTFDYNIAMVCSDNDIKAEIKDGKGEFKTSESQGIIVIEENKVELKVKNIHYGDTEFQKVFSYKASDSRNQNKVNIEQTVTNKNSNAQNNEKTQNSSSISNNSSYAEEYIKIMDKLKTEYQQNDIKCDLIYFNDDDIPDLVIGVSGYWVSLYIYEDGRVYNPVDKWAYGAGGNHGYNYQERKGTILNTDTDLAGAILTTTVAKLNSNKEFDMLSFTDKGADVDDPEIIAQVNEALEAYGGYYYNEQKISEQEYNNKLKELSINADYANSNILYGDRSIEDVKKQLQ